MVIDGGSGGPGRTGDGAPRRGRPGRAPRIEQPQTVIRLPKDPYEGEFKAPRGRRGRGVLALAALVVVVSVIIAISSSKHNNGAASQGASTGVGGGVPPATATVGQSAASGAASSPAFPTGSTSGVLVGYQDTQEGAEAAAANYAAAYGSDLMLDPTKRHAMISAIADPSIVQALTSQLDVAAKAAAQDWGLDANGNPPAGQSVVDRTAVVGVTVGSYNQNKATVSVWVDNIGGMAGQGSTRPVAEQWNTLTINLTWVENDWKWNSFTETDGPTPVQSSQQVSSPSDMQKAAQQFARLRYAP